MNPTFDPILKKMVAHNHIPEDITGLANLLKGFIGSLDVSSGTEDNPFPPPQIETSGFWMISIAGFVDLDGSSVAFEPGDLLVFDLSEYIYSRVPSIKELPVAASIGSITYWDGTKWSVYTKILLQEDTLIITNTDTFKFVISGDNTGDFIEFNDDIGYVFLLQTLVLPRNGVYLPGTNDAPGDHFQFIEPIFDGSRPGVNLSGIQHLQIRSANEEDAEFNFTILGDNKLAFSGSNNGIQYFVFDDGDGWMGLGTDLFAMDLMTPELQVTFIQRTFDNDERTKINLHNIYNLYFWDEVSVAEGAIKLADGDYYFLNSLDEGANINGNIISGTEVRGMDIVSTKNLFLKYHLQELAPTTEQLTSEAVCLWKQTSTSKTYICFNVGDFIRKVELV